MSSVTHGPDVSMYFNKLDISFYLPTIVGIIVLLRLTYELSKAKLQKSHVLHITVQWWTAYKAIFTAWIFTDEEPRNKVNCITFANINNVYNKMNMLLLSGK